MLAMTSPQDKWVAHSWWGGELASYTIPVRILLNHLSSMPPFRSQGVGFLHVPPSHTSQQPSEAATVISLHQRQKFNGDRMDKDRLDQKEWTQLTNTRPEAHGFELGTAFLSEQPDGGGNVHGRTLWPYWLIVLKEIGTLSSKKLQFFFLNPHF